MERRFTSILLVVMLVIMSFTTAFSVPAQEAESGVVSTIYTEVNGITLTEQGVPLPAVVTNFNGTTITQRSGGIPSVGTFMTEAGKFTDSVNIFDYRVLENSTEVNGTIENVWTEYQAFSQKFRFQVLIRSFGEVDSFVITEGYSWYYNRWIGGWSDPRDVSTFSGGNGGYDSAYGEAVSYADSTYDDMVSKKHYNINGFYYDPENDARYDLEGLNTVKIPRAMTDTATTSKFTYSQEFTVRVEAGLDAIGRNISIGFDPVLTICDVKHGLVRDFVTGDSLYYVGLDDDPLSVTDTSGMVASTGFDVDLIRRYTECYQLQSETYSVVPGSVSVGNEEIVQEIAPSVEPYVYADEDETYPLNPVSGSVGSHTIENVPSEIYTTVPRNVVSAKYVLDGEMQCGLQKMFREYSWDTYAADVSGNWFIGTGHYEAPTRINPGVVGSPPFPISVPYEFLLQNVYSVYTMELMMYVLVPSVVVETNVTVFPDTDDYDPNTFGGGDDDDLDDYVTFGGISSNGTMRPYDEPPVVTDWGLISIVIAVIFGCVMTVIGIIQIRKTRPTDE